MKIRHFLYRAMISIALTLLLAYFLLRQIRVESVFNLFDRIDYFYLLLSFALGLLMTLVRAVRIKVLLNSRKIDLKILFALVLENNFLINIFPFRTGDLAFPVLMNKYAGVSKKEGFLLLFYLRTLDIFVILLFFLMSALLFSNYFLHISDTSLMFVVFTLVIMTILFFKTEKILLFVINYLQKKDKLKYIKSIIGGINRILFVYKFYRSTIFSVFILSVSIFIVMIFAMGVALEAYPINLSYLNVIFFSLMIITITSLPINGIAGIGTVELGISTFLISNGADKDLSISIAFNYHFITLMMIAISAGLSHLYLAGARKREI